MQNAKAVKDLKKMEEQNESLAGKLKNATEKITKTMEMAQARGEMVANLDRDNQ